MCYVTATPLEVNSILSSDINLKRYVVSPTSLTIKIPISKLIVPGNITSTKCSEFIKFERVIKNKIPYYDIDLTSITVVLSLVLI